MCELLVGFCLHWKSQQKHLSSAKHTVARNNHSPKDVERVSTFKLTRKGIVETSRPKIERNEVSELEEGARNQQEPFTELSSLDHSEIIKYQS